MLDFKIKTTQLRMNVEFKNKHTDTGRCLDYFQMLDYVPIEGYEDKEIDKDSEKYELNEKNYWIKPAFTILFGDLSINKIVLYAIKDSELLEESLELYVSDTWLYIQSKQYYDKLLKLKIFRDNNEVETIRL